MRTFVSVAACAAAVADAQQINYVFDAGMELDYYELYGDCIGLSPVIFGSEGPYVQSDI